MCFLFLFLFSVVGMELRTSCLTARRCATELYASPLSLLLTPVSLSAFRVATRDTFCFPLKLEPKCGQKPSFSSSLYHFLLVFYSTLILFKHELFCMYVQLTSHTVKHYSIVTRVKQINISHCHFYNVMRAKSSYEWKFWIHYTFLNYSSPAVH